MAKKKPNKDATEEAAEAAPDGASKPAGGRKRLIVIAAAVLGEVLRPIQAVGALLTFVGVALASSQEQPGNGKRVARVAPNQGIEPTR